MVSLAVVGGAIAGLYLGKLDGQMFAQITMPIATAWIGAMAALLPRQQS